MRTLVAVLVAFSLTSTPAAAAWIEVRSPHYLFLGDSSRGEILRIAKRFEQFHSVLQQLMPGAVTFPVPTLVLVFKDARSLRPYLPHYQGKAVEAAGYASMGRELNYIAVDSNGGEGAYAIVFHELAHLMTRNVSNIPATWFSEGVAEYYSTFQLRNDKVARLGTPIGRHVGLLREHFMPLQKLLTVDTTSAEYNEQSRATLFYAESWALVHFLLSDTQTRPRLRQYMKLVEDGIPQEEAVNKGFATTLQALETALRRHVQQRLFLVEEFTFPKPIAETDLSAREVSEAVALPHLAALQLRFDRIDAAEKLARAAIASTPRSAAAHAVLASIRLVQEQRDDAKAWLDKDLAFESFLDHYMIASALGGYIRSGDLRSPDSQQAAAVMHQRVTAAIAAQDDVAEAWRLMAESLLLQDNTDAAKGALERALKLAPANELYRFMHADVLVRQRQFDPARAILGELMARGRTADVRDQARTMMGELVKYQRAVAAAQAGNEAVDTNARGSSRDTTATAETPSPAAPGRLVPLFRNVEPGESRIFGKFVAIECSQTGITIVVELDSRVIRVRTKGFEATEFITYREDLKGAVTCGVRASRDAVYVTWKGQDSGASEVQTDSIVVELVPVGYLP
jgi:tetratricopeptide (TPR) repeat protein